MNQSVWQKWSAQIGNIADRAVRTFAYTFLGAWIGVGGASFDNLFTVDNLKAGVVGLALSLAVSLGVTANRGTPRLTGPPS